MRDKDGETEAFEGREAEGEEQRGHEDARSEGSGDDADGT